MYPLTSDGQGSLCLSRDEDLVAESIYSVLETRPGERIMRPNYGTPDYLFESVNAISIQTGRIEAALTDQIADPDRFQVSGTYEEEGIIAIDIRYELSQVEAPPLKLKIRQ